MRNKKLFGYVRLKSFALFVSGVLIALSFSLHAFTIETTMVNVRQYIQELFVTSDGGADGDVYVHLNNDMNGEVYIAKKLAIGASGAIANLFVEWNTNLGKNNVFNTWYNSIVAGLSNQLSGNNSVLLGWESQEIDAHSAAIVVGFNNQVGSDKSVIVGGTDNVITGGWSDKVIVGGQNHVLQDGNRIAIVAGYQNTIIDGYNSFIWGWALNYINNGLSAIVGGSSNKVYANYGAIVWGYSNSVTGDYSVVIGGQSNVASGALSFAAGYRANANHNNTFVWSDDQNVDFETLTGSTFLIRAREGVGINTNNPREALEVGGAIVVGNAASVVAVTGTMKFSGDHFYGYNGNNWVRLDGGYWPSYCDDEPDPTCS